MLPTSSGAKACASADTTGGLSSAGSPRSPATDRAGNGPQRGTNHHPHRPGHHNANGFTSTHPCRAGFTLRFMGLKHDLRRRVGVLGWNAVTGDGLLYKALANGRGGCGCCSGCGVR